MTKNKEFKTSFKIGQDTVGRGYPIFIIAEIGFNHQGDTSLAKEMIHAAADAGANAVKFQTYKASALVIQNSEHYQVIQEGELSLEEHLLLRDYADKCSVSFLSTPYCTNSVDLLESVGVPTYKIASMDLTNLRLLQKVACTGKPIILSTGMANTREISVSISEIERWGNNRLVLLHCISKYPTPLPDVSLEFIPYLKRKYNLPIGYSDHSPGISASLVAAAIGATVIEKHFTIDKELDGPDHFHSADPDDLRELVKFVRLLENTSAQEASNLNDRVDRDNALDYRRGLYAQSEILEGSRITDGMIKTVRPQRGAIPIEKYSETIGKNAKKLIQFDQPINEEDID